MSSRLIVKKSLLIPVGIIVLLLVACSPAKKTTRNKTLSNENAINTLKLAPNKILLKKADPFYLNAPEGYTIHVAYEGLKRLRFLTRSPDGRLFATDMHDLTDNRQSRIYIFENWDEIAKRYKTIRIFMQGLRNVNQVLFYHSGNRDYIYIPETDKLTRYEYHAGDNAPKGKPEIIAVFPAYGLSYKYGGWHLTRSISFHNDKLYVSVGSSCNACIEKEEVRATVLEMDPDGHNLHIYASGLRNSVGIKWVGNELWATGMGQDKLGIDRPEDIFTKIEEGKYYGWPYYYHYNGKVFPDSAFHTPAKEKGYIIPGTPEPLYCGFKAHSAPLGFDHFKDFADPLLNNAFIVALHGSTDISLGRGNAIVKINGEGKYTVLIDGFLTATGKLTRNGRPCDVMMNNDHSFFFTDDMNGILYYVCKQ